jgi:hypothetical protein
MSHDTQAAIGLRTSSRVAVGQNEREGIRILVVPDLALFGPTLRVAIGRRAPFRDEEWPAWVAATE